MTALVASLLLVAVACGGESEGVASTTTAAPVSTAPAPVDSGAPAGGVPGIQSFVDNPSDRMPVDLLLARAGHPFKGKNAKTPEPSARITFGTAYENWPQGGEAASNYPPVYAVADGVVSKVVDTLADGPNDAYGIHLTIASSGTADIDFEYRIAPGAKEPSPGFYASFVTVKAGERVKRGDVIAYLYLPKGVDGSLLDFRLINTATGDAMAPAIFARPTVAEFYGIWKDLGFDSTEGFTDPIPICIGWKIDASENPYENRAVECLALPGTQVD